MQFLLHTRLFTLPSDILHEVMQVTVQDKRLHLDKELVLAIVLASVAITVIILAAFCACFIWRRKSLKSGPGSVQISGDSFTFRKDPQYLSSVNCKQKFHDIDTTATLMLSRPVLNRFNPLSIRGSIPEVEYTLIEAATNDFSENNILETEGHGVWYKAHFNFGTLAAVKKLECKEPCCERAFEVLYRFSFRVSSTPFVFRCTVFVFFDGDAE